MPWNSNFTGFLWGDYWDTCCQWLELSSGPLPIGQCPDLWMIRCLNLFCLEGIAAPWAGSWVVNTQTKTTLPHLDFPSRREIAVTVTFHTDHLPPVITCTVKRWTWVNRRGAELQFDAWLNEWQRFKGVQSRTVSAVMPLYSARELAKVPGDIAFSLFHALHGFDYIHSAGFFVVML